MGPKKIEPGATAPTWAPVLSAYATCWLKTLDRTILYNLPTISSTICERQMPLSPPSLCTRAQRRSKRPNAYNLPHIQRASSLLQLRALESSRIRMRLSLACGDTRDTASFIQELFSRRSRYRSPLSSSRAEQVSLRGCKRDKDSRH